MRTARAEMAYVNRSLDFLLALPKERRRAHLLALARDCGNLTARGDLGFTPAKLRAYLEWQARKCECEAPEVAVEFDHGMHEVQEVLRRNPNPTRARVA